MATVKNENVEVKVEEKPTEETAETGATFKDKAKQAASRAGAVAKRLLPFGGGLVSGFILGRVTSKQSNETPDEDDIVVTEDENIIV